MVVDADEVAGLVGQRGGVLGVGSRGVEQELSCGAVNAYHVAFNKSADVECAGIYIHYILPVSVLLERHTSESEQEAGVVLSCFERCGVVFLHEVDCAVEFLVNQPYIVEVFVCLFNAHFTFVLKVGHNMVSSL